MQFLPYTHLAKTFIPQGFSPTLRDLKTNLWLHSFGGTSSMVYSSSTSNSRRCWSHFSAELRLLFSQTQNYGNYADEFFSKHPQPSISWIHDLENQRYGKVSETLLPEAGNTSDMQIRHVRFSPYGNSSYDVSDSCIMTGYVEYWEAVSTGWVCSSWRIPSEQRVTRWSVFFPVDHPVISSDTFI